MRTQISIVSFLLIFLGCTSETEKVKEVYVLEDFFTEANSIELQELNHLTNQLVRLGTVNLDRSYINKLDSLHHLISYQRKESGTFENISQIEKMLYSIEQELLGKIPTTFEENGFQTKDFPSPLTSTETKVGRYKSIDLPNSFSSILLKINYLISLSRKLIWFEYLSGLGQEFILFSFSEDILGDSDSSMNYIGVYNKGVMPMFSNKYNRLFMNEESNMCQIKVANKDLARNQVSVDVKFMKPNGVIISEKINLSKGISIKEIH